MSVIKRQAIKNTLSTYAGIFLGFLSLLVVQPQLLTAEEIGLTRVLFSFSFIVSTFSALGIGQITTRYFPQFRNAAQGHSGFVAWVWIFPILGSALASLILLAFAGQIKSLYAEQSALFNTYYWLAIPYSFLLALFASLSAYSFALYKSTVPSYLNDIVNRVLFMLLVLAYALGWLSLHAFMMAFVGIHVLLNLLLWIYIRRHDQIKLLPDMQVFNRSTMRMMVRYGLLILITGASSMGIKLVDTVVLGQLVPLAEVGVYAICAFVPTFIDAPLNALDKIAMPKIADAMVHQRLEDVKRIYRLSSRYLFLLGGLLFLLTIANIDAVLTWLPPIYASGARVVKILSFAALFNLLTGSNNAIVYNSKQFYWGTAFLSSLFIASIAMLYQAIPAFGIDGAAYTIAGVSIVYNVFKFLFILRRFGLHPFDLNTIKNILITGMGAALVEWLPTFETPVLSILVNSFSIGCFYLMAAYLSGLLQRSEWHQLVHTFKKPD